jgi:hypothetical protein
MITAHDEKALFKCDISSPKVLLLPIHTTAPFSNIQLIIPYCLKIIKMNSFKNYLPFYCIAFLLVAVKGEEIEIRIRITPEPSEGYKYSVTVRCSNGKFLVSDDDNYGASIWVAVTKTKTKRVNGVYREIRKRICPDTQYNIYVQKIDAGGSSDGVSREF